MRVMKNIIEELTEREVNSEVGIGQIYIENKINITIEVEKNKLRID
jgi:hypothetical protein